MIDFGKQIEVPARELIIEYLAFVDDVLYELGSRKEIAYIHTMFTRAPALTASSKSSENHHLKAVVDYMAAETKAGL
jgi:carboxylate-amine ligase